MLDLEKLKKEEILKNLEPMFKRAKKEGKWFHSYIQDIIFSPKELREDQANGKYIWGPDNWELVNPKEELKDLEHVAKCAQKDVERFKARMKAQTH